MPPKGYRKVRDADIALAEPDTKHVDPAENILKTEDRVRTRDGESAEIPREGFDFRKLNGLTPFNYDEELPPAETRVNRRGKSVLIKNGEPRFYFRGTHLIKIYNGLSGKKTDLFKRFKPDAKPLHRQIMTYLKKRGIPEVY